MKTTLAKKGDVQQKWYVVDAEGQILGRMATKIATVMMGKHKPIYTPNVDTGDYVIVLNADKVRVTGAKAGVRYYDRYTGYVGGRKVIPFRRMMQRHPERVVQFAVKRMLPKNKLGRSMFKKLKVYKGSEHEHSAQKPEKLEL